MCPSRPDTSSSRRLATVRDSREKATDQKVAGSNPAGRASCHLPRRRGQTRKRRGSEGVIMRRLLVAAFALLVVAGVATAHAAGRSDNGHAVDRLWTAPGFSGRSLRSIAMLPPASYDHDLATENLVASQWGQALKDAGFRRVSAGTSRTLLESQLGD